MTRTALAIRHLAFEDLGLLEPVLHRHGYVPTYLDAGIDDLDDGTADADLVIILGGPIGANDEVRYPFLNDELAAIARRAQRRLPTLGICLGAQLLARSLGAIVAPNGQSEIGYSPLTLTAAGSESPLRHLEGVPVLHWHNDQFSIPAGAQRLASTDSCENQAFAYGPNLLGLQFHAETPPGDIERWLIGHAEALTAADIDPQAIRTAAVFNPIALEEAAGAVFDDWLTQLSH